MTIVCGVDLSLTSSGLARIHIDTSLLPHTPGADPGYLIRKVEVARHRTKPTGDDIRSRSLRLRRIAATVTRSCAGAALVCIEGPAYGMKAERGNFDRSGLWWLVASRLDAMDIPVVEVSPSSVKVYATGKGGGPDASKDSVLAAVIRRYPAVEVSGNDEADALVLAAMAARHLGFPVEPTLPQTHLRASLAVRWPITEIGAGSG